MILEVLPENTNTNAEKKERRKEVRKNIQQKDKDNPTGINMYIYNKLMC